MAVDYYMVLTEHGRPLPPRDAPTSIPGRRSSVHPFNDYEHYGPSLADMLRRWLQNFSDVGRPKSQAVRDVDVEVLIDPDEAMAGTNVSLEIPTYQPCETCGGSGRAGFYICDECEGQGLLLERHRVDVLVPAGTRDDTVIPVSLRTLGVRNFFLNVHVRVGQAAS